MIQVGLRELGVGDGQALQGGFQAPKERQEMSSGKWSWRVLVTGLLL